MKFALTMPIDLKAVLLHTPAEKLSGDQEAAVTEKAKKLSEIAQGHGAVTHFTLKQTIRQGCDNKCIIRYIYSRQQSESLSIGLTNGLVPLGYPIRFTLV